MARFSVLTQFKHLSTERSHFWLFLIWLGPGAVVSFLLRDWLPWTAFMSWYAIIVTHAGADKAAQAKSAVERGS